MPSRLLWLALPVLLLFAPAAGADVVVTADGLRIEGEVETLENGWLRVTTDGGEVELAPESVRRVERGKAPRAALEAKLEAAGDEDVRGLFALALEAEAAGFPDLAEAAYQRVVDRDPDHAAARRALGFERVGGADGGASRWVPIAEARRSQGLVLFDGRWMLPEEVEARGAQPARLEIESPESARRALDVIRRLASDDLVLRRAARVALARTDDALVLAGAKAALFAGDPAVRKTAAGVLGRLGDESALRALIFSGARDVDPSVRRAAVEAARSFGHDDLAVPFVRALGSTNQRLVANAAQALAQIGDERAAGYVVKRLRSHGASSRNYVAFLTQVSYVRDYDVEIAQASNIANPDVATINEGVVLDAKVLDAGITKTWIEPVLVDSLAQLAGRPLRSKAEAIAWWAENGASWPDFPKRPGRRAPRRAEGKKIGLPD